MCIYTVYIHIYIYVYRDIHLQYVYIYIYTVYTVYLHMYIYIDSVYTYIYRHGYMIFLHVHKWFTYEWNQRQQKGVYPSASAGRYVHSLVLPVVSYRKKTKPLRNKTPFFGVGRCCDLQQKHPNESGFFAYFAPNR